MNLKGYTSTSKSLEVAKSFAFNELTEGKCAVIYKIYFRGDEGLLDMSDSNFSAFAGEREVLIQDGFQYKIKSIEEIKDTESDNYYIRVDIAYPSN